MKKLLSLVLTLALIFGMIPGSYAASNTTFKSVNDLSGYLYLQNGAHIEAYHMTSKALYSINRTVGTMNFVESKTSQIFQAPQLSKDKKSISFYIDRGDEYEYVFTYKFTKNTKGNVVLQITQPNGESTLYTVKVFKNLKDLTSTLKNDKSIQEGYKQDLAAAKRQFKSVTEVQGVWYSPETGNGIIIGKNKFDAFSRQFGTTKFSEAKLNYSFSELVLSDDHETIYATLNDNDTYVTEVYFKKDNNGKVIISYDKLFESPCLNYKTLADVSKAAANDSKLAEQIKLEAANNVPITIENVAGTWSNAAGSEFVKIESLGNYEYKITLHTQSGEEKVYTANIGIEMSNGESIVSASEPGLPENVARFFFTNRMTLRIVDTNMIEGTFGSLTLSK